MGVIILNFHGLGTPRAELPKSERELWIDETLFAAILDCVKSWRDVHLTFDDGNESDYALALPALQARKLTAQFFVVANRIDQPHYLSQGQIKSLVAAGMAVGNHGMRHRPWAGLDRKEMHEELVEARERLEDITGGAIRSAACPFGSYNRRVIHALHAAGYTRVYTSDGGPAVPDSFLLPRTSIRRNHDLAAIERMVTDEPDLLRKVSRHLNLAWKRWR